MVAKIVKHYEPLDPNNLMKESMPFVSPFDITLKVDHKINVVQPDLGVICDVDHVDEKDRYIGIPTLVVEILSKSSVSRDMVKKLNAYMLTGVKEYWMVDPFNDLAKVYCFHEYEIKDYRDFRREDGIGSLFFDGLCVKW